tara:strand:- start:147 stop:446 length:300 start_codon:yes stop_codon:yes gene_type:complete
MLTLLGDVMVIIEDDKGEESTILNIDNSKDGIFASEMVSGLEGSRLKGGLFVFKSEIEKVVRGDLVEKEPNPDLISLSFVVVPSIIFGSLYVYWRYRKT